MTVPQVCNCCAKVLDGEPKGQRTEEAVHIHKEWGYFSGRDLECHHIILCEDCYNKWIKTFKIPVRIEIKQEVI